MTSTSGQEASSNPRTYNHSALLAELNHLDLTSRASIKNLTVVASGAFGDISKSQCTFDGRQITAAVKRLRFYLKEDVDLIFEKEIYVWSKLQHPNILSLLGFAFEESSGYPLLLSEWMPNGSSLNYVKNNNGCDLIRLVTGIAEGLTYLHEKGIVHSDIKPDNVMVTDAGDARICDFGGSRIADASKSVAKPSTGIRGTQRYLSFELVALPDQYPRHTKESDVWAFGMTVFALIAQEHPFALIAEEKATLRNVCNLCWDHEPKDRATMNVLRTSLQYSNSHRKASRPLDSDKSESRDAKRCRISSAAGNSTSDTVVITNSLRDARLNENSYLYRPLVMLTSKLGELDGHIDAASEIYQYLHSAMKMSLSLHDNFTDELQIDEKLDHLMRAMLDVFAIIAARSTALSLRNEKKTIIRLLQQAIECFLFVNTYLRNSFEDRRLGANDSRKMFEFISFFVAFKEALDLGSGILPVFVSSGAAHSIDESVLRQRLRPSEADMSSQRLCLLGTRAEVQETINEWVLSSSNQKILWLRGVAGSGKSTVVASVAEHFRGIYRLGAFLRFTRGASDPSSVIRTIAFKFALSRSSTGSLILAETDRDKEIANAPLATQFEKLLSDPLAATADVQKGPVVIILDALDECGSPATRKSLMQVLLRGISNSPSNFRFLITSRQEHDINKAFSALRPESITTFELDYTSHLSHRDVRLYLTHELRNIVDVDGDDSPDDGWLEKQITMIAETAAGLFVFASTIVKLVSEHDNPPKRLIELASSMRSLRGLDQLYSTILRDSGISWHDETSKTRFQRVIGLILLNKAPLTESTIDAILGPSAGKCRITFSRLRSVVNYRPGEPIRLFHASFSDFLMSSGDTEDWFVDIPAQESFLATRCFEIMKAEMRFNICDLKSSFVHNDVVDDIKDRIESRISPQLSYACRFWSLHLCNVLYGPGLMGELSCFLKTRLLFWLEVLSLLKGISIVGPALLTTARWIENNDAEVVAFVRDARRLINIFALPISQSVPHIYLSMLPLMAAESKVSAHFLQHASSMVRVTRRGVKRQSPLLKLLEGNGRGVSSVDFSPDGSLIVSGSWDRTVRIWDTERGELTAGPFAGHVGWINSISFLHDGTRFVVGGDDGIAVLDVESGSIVVGPFGGECTWSIAVSPDGKHIVSAFSNVIRMWDLESGMIVGESFVGHIDEVLCVGYSHDAHFIVSGWRDGCVRVWDVKSRRLVRELFIGHTSIVYSVTFSPDGKLVVSGSDDAIRIWNVEKGEVEFKLDKGANSVAYSSDGTHIVSCSSLFEVGIWNSQNGQLIAGPFKHPGYVICVALSPDETRVVSGSYDGNLRIWDAEIGKIDSDSGPERVHSVGAVRFSSDCSCVISEDGTTWRIEDGSVVSKGDKLEYQTLAITAGMKFDFEGTLKWNSNTRTGETVPYSSWRLAVSPNGKRFAFGSYDGMIKVWDKERDVLVCGPFNGQGGCIYSLTFSPDGRHIASGSKGTRVWDAEAGKLLFGPFIEHTDVNCIAYSPDGRHIASGSDDNTARVWDIETGRSKVFKGHTKEVRSVAYSPNGSLLVSVSVDHDIRVWNTGTSREFIPTVQDPHLASRKTDPSKWMLDADGWIRGAHDELLLWVPLDLRPTLCDHRKIAVFNVEFSTALDFSGSAQGEHWHECFHHTV